MAFLCPHFHNGHYLHIPTENDNGYVFTTDRTSYLMKEQKYNDKSIL